jgi:hypothetical protein
VIQTKKLYMLLIEQNRHMHGINYTNSPNKYLQRETTYIFLRDIYMWNKKSLRENKCSLYEDKYLLRWNKYLLSRTIFLWCGINIHWEGTTIYRRKIKWKIIKKSKNEEIRKKLNIWNIKLDLKEFRSNMRTKKV